MYHKLLQMSGQKCYTLTTDSEAVMSVDDDGVTITYLSGNKLFMPRSMVEKAIDTLLVRGTLTVADVHEGITNHNGARTDRLMAILRKLPDVTYKRRPRELYHSKH